MVVISIIGLLSSIVLVSIKDAREKAAATKIKSEMTQLINALELYKNATGLYPYEDTLSSTNNNYVAGIRMDNIEFPGSGPKLSAMLSSYMATIPKIPYPDTTNTTSWQYKSGFGPNPYRCAGYTGTPKYVILIFSASVSQTNSFMFNTFSQIWPAAEVWNSGIGTWNPSTLRCFSLK